MIAVGVARPNAHGQAMTTTAVKAINAKVKLLPSMKNHTRNVATATMRTNGTNQLEILSAVACIGAFEFCASSMSLIILERVVSFPIRVDLNSKLPLLLIVAPITLVPICFSTGILSPVIIDSSTLEDPFVISPSTAIFSPGRTTIISPSCTSSTGMSTVAPSRTTRAVFA